MTSDGTLIALLGGASKDVGALLQTVGLATVNVPRAENVDGQLSKRASTYHAAAPCGTCVVKDVVLELPRSETVAAPAVAAQIRYELAPVTAVHVNVTGVLTVAPAGGAVREGDCGFAGHPAVPPTAVKRKCGDPSVVQLSASASTHHSTDPAGTFAVFSVSRVIAIGFAAPPLNAAISR